MLSIQAGGCAVNVDSDDLTSKYETLSEIAFAVGKGFRLVLASLGIPAPATFAEIEACSFVSEHMCGSNSKHIDSYLSIMRGHTADSIVASLEELTENEDALFILAKWPVTELLEETQWAA